MIRSLFEPELSVPDLSLKRDGGWGGILASFMASEMGVSLCNLIEVAVAEGKAVYPPKVFRALEETPLEAVRVVILGQDPYHGPGQAEGLSFSVPDGVRIPPSLRNIKKELERDLGLPVTKNGSLLGWARQGVLLLNAILTVEAGKAASHRGMGWENLTDRLISAVSEHSDGCVFMLWGGFAQSKRTLIDESKHLVLTANHPSPLSALRPPTPFIGCGHFGEANRWLSERGENVIDWRV